MDEKLHAVIFDLDGTLIDSQPGIFASLKIALADSLPDSNLSSSQVPIGPPLVELIKSLTGFSHPSDIDPIVQRFKTNYDSVGYKSSCLFDGVYDLLCTLRSRSIHLFIATNKRLEPTQKILQHLSIDSFFHGVYSVDSSPSGFSSKSAMLRALLNDYSLGSDTIYIGDRLDDLCASRENSLPFLLPAWGYSSDFSLFPDDVVPMNLSSVEKILSLMYP